MEISMEYISTITDLEEISDVRKIVRLEKGQLTSIENQLDRVENKLKDEDRHNYISQCN